MAARLEQMLYRDDAMWVPHPIGMYRYVGATIHVRNRETPSITDVFPMGGAMEAELVRTKADLLTARKDLAEFHRELGIERRDHADEIAELKAVVVAQARRLATLEGDA
ncbi:hypothetical protein OG436_29460 [Streptomyces caniferus]|uniref:hypothetical protein n=1 Tax=Streptomyces caniferus TaxID=285557 RepID=UPI002E294B57|nr:hypothetical protein [Streptomyces caniferus]